MSLLIDRQRVAAALGTARSDLLLERTRTGHWVGELASSPLATATAVSALVIAEQYGSLEQHGRKADQLWDTDQIFQSDLSELIVQSLHWLACHQNEDGGWGDTDKSRSNIATTMLVKAALYLTGVPAKYSGLSERAEAYIRQVGGVGAIRKRYGRDKSFAAPVLANCALAGLIPWKEVPALPFELACLPRSWQRALRLPVVSYSTAALIAVGQAVFHHRRPLNPVARLVRRLSRTRGLRRLEVTQPENGGFLESIPLTSFVVMSLASIGLAEHKVVRRGVEFLLGSVRGDGSWPINTNLATRNSALALCALSQGDHCRGSALGVNGTRLKVQDSGFAIEGLGSRAEGSAVGVPDLQPAHLDPELSQCVDWLLECQHWRQDPVTGAPPGGWSWTNRSGGTPSVDDSATALVALARAFEVSDSVRRRHVEAAAKTGIEWLLHMQNEDGGWPTFSRGWDFLPADRSASDVTATALRALASFKNVAAASPGQELVGRIDQSSQAAITYLKGQQREDGSWIGLWFGNQENADDKNPVVATSCVLMALADFGYATSDAARLACDWLCGVQHASGAWGPVVGSNGDSPWRSRGGSKRAAKDFDPHFMGPSVEETALAVEALLRVGSQAPAHVHAAEQGLAWLVEAVENGRHHEPAPLGFHLGRMWYYERLYPRIFAAEALEVAASCLSTGERIGTHHQSSSLQAVSS